MADWDVSQVTDAQKLFAGRSSFYQGITGWTGPVVRIGHDGDVLRRRHLAVPCVSHGWVRFDGRTAERWVFIPCLENELQMENGVCAPCTGGGTRAAGDDPTFPRHWMRVSGQSRAEDRGGQLPRRRCHRRGVLQPGRGLRSGGDGRDAVLGRFACDGHERLVRGQRVLQRGHIAVGRQLGHEHVPDVQNAGAFNADISRWDVNSVTNMHRMFQFAFAFNADITRWDTSVGSNMEQMFFIAMGVDMPGSEVGDCGFDSSHQACGEVAFYTVDRHRPRTRTHGPRGFAEGRVRCGHWGQVPPQRGRPGDEAPTLLDAARSGRAPVPPSGMCCRA